MKSPYKTFILCLTFMAGFLTVISSQEAEHGDILRHVVLFKFKDSSSAEDVAMVCQAFEGLQDEIDKIKGFEWGENNSPEGLNQGLTHCFIADFSSEADRDAYLVDPAHQKFVEKLRPHLDKVTVVDYWKK